MCSAKLFRSAMSATISLQLTNRDINDSETVYFVIKEHHLIGSCIFFVKLCVFCLFLQGAPPDGEKNTNSRFLRFLVRSVPLFRSLMLTPMECAYFNLFPLTCVRVSSVFRSSSVCLMSSRKNLAGRASSSTDDMSRLASMRKTS